MARPSLEDIFAEDDAFGLLDVKPAATPRATGDARNGAIVAEVRAFQQKHGRLPDPDADNHDEMRLGTIWGTLPPSVTGQLEQEAAKPVVDWRAKPADSDIPDSLDDIFDDDLLDVDPSLFALNHSSAAASRQTPDHRADFVPCRDFYLFEQRFADIQAALESGQRKAHPVKKGAIFEPIEGDVFIRNGLFALIAEKSEMTVRGGSRDHRLRVIFSNGTESDPLMSSFRKSLNDDATARFVEKVGLGPLDPEWEADRLNLSGTIYVLRSLSEEPIIKKDRMILHKIGVTSQDVRRRIADARNDPTFLMAPVEIVAELVLRNLPRNKVEHLLHRFFEDARPAGLFIQDRFGKTIHPKEWFYVLPEHVSQAAQLIKTSELHHYRYDANMQKIIRMSVDAPTRT